MPLRFRRPASIAIAAMLIALCARRVSAQQHDHAHMNMSGTGWQFMQDGVVFVMFNDQSGPRGGTDFVAPSWWMGMLMRNTKRGTVTLTGMYSLDPALVGTDGYHELFQAGEVFEGRPLVDRQHPHDLFMQMSASWRFGLSSSTSLTLTGAPVGAPALGPVPYMHRASSFDNPITPLTHHLF